MCARFIIGKINALLNRAERMHSISGKPALNYRAACSNWSVYTSGIYLGFCICKWYFKYYNS